MHDSYLEYYIHIKKYAFYSLVLMRTKCVMNLLIEFKRFISNSGTSASKFIPETLDLV